MGGPVLKVDGVMGPNTRKGIQEAMRIKGVRNAKDLFTRGVRGVVWHWTAGAKGFIELEREAYNALFSVTGDRIDGNSTIQEQVNYDWRNGVGASHTKSMNTDWWFGRCHGWCSRIAVELGIESNHLGRH